ncbi:hypothetical protein M8J77_021806 [Diaphorina citri]|nr:hypothetical protein M8J77_021806 [Diaphorina citri]
MFGFYLADINVIVVIVYLSMFLDNILLTVVVPILPDYLYWLENFNVPHLNITKSAQDSNDITLEQSEVLGNENGKVGILLASKALIQILINPLIGVLTQYVGYNVIMFVGSVNLLIATLLFALGDNYFMLLLARSLQGFASSCIGVAAEIWPVTYT